MFKVLSCGVWGCGGSDGFPSVGFRSAVDLSTAFFGAVSWFKEL